MGISAQSLMEAADVKMFVPQDDPMVMVDAFYGMEGKMAVAGLTVKRDNPFVEADVLSETGLMEHMAQSAALQHGVFCRQCGEKPPVGFIGAIQGFKLHALPRVGEIMKTTVFIEQEIMGVTLVSIKVESGQRPLAECKMKIFMKERQ